jgi:hypothetical protein
LTNIPDLLNILLCLRQDETLSRDRSHNCLKKRVS